LKDPAFLADAQNQTNQSTLPQNLSALDFSKPSN